MPYYCQCSCCCVSIYTAPVGEDITVTLRPALTPVYQDDAALIFRVTSKLPSLRTEDLPKDVIEEEISRLFRDEDFDMHLDGRFADKWDTDADWVGNACHSSATAHRMQKSLCFLTFPLFVASNTQLDDILSVSAGCCCCCC